MHILFLFSHCVSFALLIIDFVVILHVRLIRVLLKTNQSNWDLGCLDFGGHRLGAIKSGVSWRNSSTKVWPAKTLAKTQLVHLRGVRRCTILLEHKVVARHCAYRWQQFLSLKHTTIVCTVYFCATELEPSLLRVRRQ